MIIIVNLSRDERDALKRIPVELRGIREEIGGLRAAAERIATALESQPEPRDPAEVVWQVGTPREE